ncbi:hypothetical protein Sjap_024612 [Stephania japonica]|uniref:Uncharacterized protein n=1 Tax=Stephania japonica TaxID=461633 RepID=A0AAP0EDP9_9MAGN
MNWLKSYSLIRKISMHRIILEMHNKVIQGKRCHDKVSRTLVTQGVQEPSDLPRDAHTR